MATPSYILNLSVLDREIAARGFANRNEFIERCGIPRRTFQHLVSGERGFTDATIARIMDPLPGLSFHHLFVRTAA